MSIVHDSLEKAKGAIGGAMQKAIALAPDGWVPGGIPDPLIREQHGKVGKPISRVDGPLKVAGKAPFSAEFPLDGMLYAAVAFSTIAKGRITAIDIAAAEAAPGVALVMTHENLPPTQAMPPFMSQPRAAGPNNLHLLEADIHWNGQPVAVVLAETQEQADHAKSLIVVTYEEAGDALTDHAVARERGTELANFQGQPLQVKIGDAQDALDAAPHKVDHRYFTPSHNHNPIELHGCTVVWDDDKLRVHDASQAVSFHAWTLAHIFGVAEQDVHVTSLFVGGGFGSKTIWYHQPLAAAAAKLAGRPVRLNLSREGVYRSVGGRSLTEQRCALAAEADGTFVSLIHTGVCFMTPHNVMPEPFILASMSVYAAKAMHLEVRYGQLDMLANTFMRAPGEAVGTFALESAIDELAHDMAIDPIELRLKNEPEQDPVQGLPHSQRDTVKMYRDGAARFGWDQRQAPGARREGEWLIGLGVATATYPYHRMPGGAARITLTAAGAKVEIAAHEMGMGTATAHKQVTADRLGLELEQVDFVYGDSVLPGDVLAGGSQQTASIGASVIAAQHVLYAELIKLAGNDSPLAGLKADEVGGFRGGIAALEDASQHESYASILARAQRSEVVAEAMAPKPLELQHWSMHSHGAVFVEAAVNAVTGETRIRRMLGSFDCGRILNPKTAASQFKGGMIMGLGLALTEETMVDERTGRIMNPNLAEYHVPVHLDVPAIEIMWTDIPDPHAPMGARGIGEIGITGVGAAVANAIFNATGKRVRDLPLTLDKLL